MNSCTSSSDSKMKDDNRTSRVFIFYFISMFMIVSVSYWYFRIYFRYTGDLLSMREAAGALVAREDGCLYRNVISSRTHYLFKRELLKSYKDSPEVIVLGSSRMLLFNRNMFTASFLNMGRAGNHLRSAITVLNDLIEEGRLPKLLLIGVDFWWFHPLHARRPGQAVNPRDISPDNFSDIMQMLWRSIQKPEYFFGGWRNNTCNLGIDSILNDRGFDKAGFMYSGDMQKRKGGGHHFADVLNRIKYGIKRFERSKNPDEKMLDEFVGVLNNIKDKGVVIILFMPPLPDAVARSMENAGGYKYVDKVREMLSGIEGVKFFSFDRKMGVFSDCQFIDGIHQGDTVNAQMLLDMSKKEKRIQEYLNVDFLRWMANYRNNALVINSLRSGLEERDFLGIGCKKDKVEIINKESFRKK